jgi:hypothetical protein
MAAYAYNKCEYYMQLEDDITTVPGYLEAINSYINSMREVILGANSFITRVGWRPTVRSHAITNPASLLFLHSNGCFWNSLTWVLLGNCLQIQTSRVCQPFSA